MKRNCLSRKSGCRIKDRSGETLIEVLAAVLVSLLAVLVLSVSIVKAARMIRDSRDALREYYDSNNAIVLGAEPNASGAVTVTIDGVAVSVPVQYFENARAAGYPVVSYHPADDPQAGNGGGSQ